MRKTLPLIAAAIAVLALAACSSGSPKDATAAANCSHVASGSQSDSVKVTGDFNKTPTVKIKAPLKATKVERTVAITGKGKTPTKGRTVDIGLAAYNGTTGKQISVGGFGTDAKLPVILDDTQQIPGLVRAVECLPTGSRAVLTASAKSVFGTADPSQAGLKTTDSVVFVVDIDTLEPPVPTRADGAPQPATPGFPTVALDKTGKPTITIPKNATPPTTTKVAVLKKGTGATVASGDTVTVQYQGVVWSTGKVFDQSWGKGPTPFPTTGVIPGFTKALVGQTVGSQVIAVIPPVDGYGSAGQPSAGIKGTDTIVFVVDILKTSK